MNKRFKTIIATLTIITIIMPFFPLKALAYDVLSDDERQGLAEVMLRRAIDVEIDDGCANIVYEHGEVGVDGDDLVYDVNSHWDYGNGKTGPMYFLYTSGTEMCFSTFPEDGYAAYYWINGTRYPVEYDYYEMTDLLTVAELEDAGEEPYSIEFTFEPAEEIEDYIELGFDTTNVSDNTATYNVHGKQVTAEVSGEIINGIAQVDRNDLGSFIITISENFNPDNMMVVLRGADGYNVTLELNENNETSLFGLDIPEGGVSLCIEYTGQDDEPIPGFEEGYLVADFDAENGTSGGINYYFINSSGKYLTADGTVINEQQHAAGQILINSDNKKVEIPDGTVKVKIGVITDDKTDTNRTTLYHNDLVESVEKDNVVHGRTIEINYSENDALGFFAGFSYMPNGYEPQEQGTLLLFNFNGDEESTIKYKDADSIEHSVTFNTASSNAINIGTRIIKMKIPEGKLGDVRVKVFDENLTELQLDIRDLTRYGSGQDTSNYYNDWIEELISGEEATLNLSGLDDSYTFLFEITLRNPMEDQMAHVLTWTNTYDSAWGNDALIDGGFARLVRAYDADGHEIWNVNETYSDDCYALDQNNNRTNKFIYGDPLPFEWERGEMYEFAIDQDNDGGEVEAVGGVQLVFEFTPVYGKQLTHVSLGNIDGDAQGEARYYKVTMPTRHTHFNAQFDDINNEKMIGNNTSITEMQYTLDNEALDSGTAILSIEKVDNLSNEQKQEFESLAGDGYEISTYLDVDLTQVWFKGTNAEFNESTGYSINDVWTNDIYDLGTKKATITITLDEGIQPEDVIILHELHDEYGDPTGYEFVNILEKNQNVNGIWTITFETSKFSNFAIASKLEEVEKFNVTFNTNGGSVIASQEVESGSTATKPADPTKDGYNFIGWYADETLKIEYNFNNPITQDTIIYAKWEEIIIHNIVKVPAKAATCEEDGNIEYYKCTDCDMFFEDAEGKTEIVDHTSVIIRASHNLEHIAAKDATCEENGNIEYYRCTVCDKYFRDAEGQIPIADKGTVVIPGLHILTRHDAVVPTCDHEGNIEYYSCSKCNKFYEDEEATTEIIDHSSVVIPAAHTIEHINAKAATCDENGNIEYYRCTKCDKYFEDAQGTREITDKTSVVVPASHSLEHIASKEATCNENGNIEYYKCTKCDKYFEDSEGTKEITDKTSVVISAGHNIICVDSKNATCTEDGNIEYYKCTRCDKYFEDEEGTREITDKTSVVIKASHDLTHIEAKDSTCDETGNIEYYKCSRCDKYFEDSEGTREITNKQSVIIPAAHELIHIDGKAKTCEEDGNIEYYKCSKCDRYYRDSSATNEITDKQSVIIKASHDLTHVEAKDATCTENGNIEYYKCLMCDKYFSDSEGKNEITDKQSVIIPAGHTIEHIEAKTATCEEDGNIEYYKCTRCDKYFSDSEGKNEITDKQSVIIKASHDLIHIDGKAKTCEEDGNIEYYKCNKCNKYFRDSEGKNEITDKQSVIIKASHDLTHIDGKAKSCEEDGNIEYYKCSVCDKYFRDSEGKNEITDKTSVIIPAGHEIEHIYSKIATCEEDGNIEYYKCTRCNKYYEDAEGTREILDKTSVIIKASHDLTHIEAKAKTCEEDGNIEYYRCTKCDKYYSDSSATNEIKNKESVIIKASHALLHVNANAATCMETGNIEYYICSVCSKMFTDSNGKNEVNNIVVPIDNNAHDWDEGIVTLEPTCTTDGIKTYTCKHNASHTKTEVIPAAHDWDEWVIIKEATVDEEGLKTRTCKVDSSHTETEVIPRLPYEIIEGENQTIEAEKGKDLVIRANGSVEKLVEIRLDNEVLDPSLYTIESGSTIIKLASSVLDTLATGNHRLTFVYTDGEVSTNFKIARENDETENIANNETIVEKAKNIINPGTGDIIYIYFAMFAISSIGLVALKNKKNKKINQKERKH